MKINPNEIQSVIYFENHYELIITLKSDKPTHIIIKRIKNFTEALQKAKALEIPIGIVENLETYY